jgi:hypothetical protein
LGCKQICNVFPVRYELNFCTLFRRNSVFKGLVILSYYSTLNNSLCVQLNIIKLSRNHSQLDTWHTVEIECMLQGDGCMFRHEPSALGCETICSFWQQGKCLNQHCNFRHMQLRVSIESLLRLLVRHICMSQVLCIHLVLLSYLSFPESCYILFVMCCGRPSPNIIVPNSLFGYMQNTSIGILKPVSEPGYFVASWWHSPLCHRPKVTVDQ